MILTDTHIHLYAEEFNPDRQELIERAISGGVKNFLMPNVDHTSIEGLFQLSNAHPGNCFPMMGLHPCYVTADWKEQLKPIRKALDGERHRVVAVGEIGLDFYWDLSFKWEQELVFREQMQWAAELELPVSIHSRNSTAEIISIIREMNLGVTTVFHCFSGDMNQADEIVNLGGYLGIGGVVTFKNSTLSDIVRDAPADRLLLETDAPYLAPTPCRGKRNIPEYLKFIAERVAEIRKQSLDEIAAITTRNAQRVFHGIQS